MWSIVATWAVRKSMKWLISISPYSDKRTCTSQIYLQIRNSNLRSPWILCSMLLTTTTRLSWPTKRGIYFMQTISWASLHSPNSFVQPSKEQLYVQFEHLLSQLYTLFERKYGLSIRFCIFCWLTRGIEEIMRAFGKIKWNSTYSNVFPFLWYE